VVGDPGIEPGVSRLGGVTVPCRTLQRVAQTEDVDTCSFSLSQHLNVNKLNSTFHPFCRVPLKLQALLNVERLELMLK
jgi:hypothetical protein